LLGIFDGGYVRAIASIESLGEGAVSNVPLAFGFNAGLFGIGQRDSGTGDIEFTTAIASK